ncbi:MAG TPA: hypothetical protein VHO70_17690 [Chitinispirillaceae bacterium]|nr:hypothetical protein [Chitinispirillaceae bacterium]
MKEMFSGFSQYPVRSGVKVTHPGSTGTATCVEDWYRINLIFATIVVIRSLFT